MNAFKKAFTGLAFGALLAAGTLLVAPSARAQFFAPGLSASSMSSVGGRSNGGNFSASASRAWGSGYASTNSYDGWGGTGTYVDAGSSAGGNSRSVGNAASGYMGFSNGTVFNFSGDN